MPKRAAMIEHDLDSPSDGAGASSEGYLLICDDDAELRQLLATLLTDHGYVVTAAGNGRELTRLLRSGPAFDLVILDIMLPGQSGLEICRELRAASTVPILMLTARGDETDRIIGLELGADDYMAKPFSPNELLARVKALLRRARMGSRSGSEGRLIVFEFEGWRLDTTRRELRNPSGVIIDLSVGEYDLLLAFLAVAACAAVRASRFGLALAGIGADEERAQTLGVNTRRAKIAGFALAAFFAGALGAAMAVRWTYIEPASVFNPFIGFQTVLIAMIGGAQTLIGPIVSAVVFSVLTEFLRLQFPYAYLITLGVLLILLVLYLPGGLASLIQRFRRADA